MKKRNTLHVEYITARPDPSLLAHLSNMWLPYGIELSWDVKPMEAERTGAIRLIDVERLEEDGEVRQIRTFGEERAVPAEKRRTVLLCRATPEQTAAALARVIFGWADAGREGSEERDSIRIENGRLLLSEVHALRARDRVCFDLQSPPTEESGRLLWIFANPYTDTLTGPYGLELLAQTAKEHGFASRICNPFVEFLNPAQGLRSLIDSYQPDLLGISLRNLDDALIVHELDGDPHTVDTQDLFAEVRQLLAELRDFSGPVVVGGAAFGTAPELFLEQLGLQYGLIGTGEAAIRDLCAAWRPHESPSDAASETFHKIWTRLPGAIWRSEPSAYARNPMSRERHLQQPAAVQRLLPYVLMNRWDRLPEAIRGSQGCAIGCKYCLESVNRKIVSWRGVEEVVDEIEFALHHYGSRQFHLTDSEANIPFTRLTDLAEEIMRRGLDGHVLWTAYLNVRPFEPDAVPLLAASGLYRLKFAFDHFHDDMLRGYGKNFREADILQLIEGLARYREHAQLMAGVLLGGPGESEETLAYAIRRMREAAGTGISFYYNAGVRLYPGTPFAELLKDPSAAPHLYGEGKTDDALSPLVYCAPKPPRELARELEERFADHPGIFRMNQVKSCALGREGYRRFLVAWHAFLDGREEEALQILEEIPHLHADRQAQIFHRLLRIRKVHRLPTPALKGGM